MKNLSFNNTQILVLTASNATVFGGGGLQRNRLSSGFSKGSENNILASDSSKFYRTWVSSVGFCLARIYESDFYCSARRAANFLASGALGPNFCLDGEVEASFLTLAAIKSSFCLGQNHENFRLAELRT